MDPWLLSWCKCKHFIVWKPIVTLRKIYVQQCRSWFQKVLWEEILAISVTQYTNIKPKDEKQKLELKQLIVCTLHTMKFTHVQQFLLFLIIMHERPCKNLISGLWNNYAESVNSMSCINYSCITNLLACLYYEQETPAFTQTQQWTKEGTREAKGTQKLLHVLRHLRYVQRSFFQSSP